MQYVNVVVNSKTKKIDQKFTYLIQSDQLPDIKPGVLILVPFGKKKIEGVIWSIKRFAAEKIKYKLKPIIKILDKTPVLDKTRRKLAEMISNYYFASIGETVFFMIPSQAKRINLDDFNSEIIENTSVECIKNRSFKSGKTYTLHGRYNNRIDNYLKIIKKAIKNKKQVLILIPELIVDNILIEKMKSQFKNQILICDSSKTKTNRYKDWLCIRAKKYQIVIGTRSTIFAPLSNLGLIIIDQPHHFAYKEEQSPRYNSVTVAKWLIKYTNANLILGDLSPDVETKFKEIKKNYTTIKKNDLKSSIYSHIRKNLRIDLIDSTKEKSIISWQLEKAITHSLENKQKIILFVSRKGIGSALICKDCGYIFKCPNCNIPLIEHGGEPSFLFCNHCNKKFKSPLLCNNCKSNNLKSIGAGIDKISSIIKKLFPKAKILKIDRNNDMRQAICDKRYATSDYDIVIGTKKIFSYPNITADLVGVISIDNILNLPDYKSAENTYSTLVELINKTKSELIIQTYNIEKDFFRYFIHREYDKFLLNELALRKKFSYPPFVKLIKIIYQHRDKKKAEKEINKIYKKLSVVSCQLSDKLIGPIPCWLEKIRGKYRYQIIIKLPVASYKLSDKLKQVIESIPQGTSVDVDPLSLL